LLSGNGEGSLPELLGLIEMPGDVLHPALDAHRPRPELVGYV